MDQQPPTNRIPLIFALLGAALLIAGGIFFFASKDEMVRGDKAVYAEADADRAISAAGLTFTCRLTDAA